MSPETPIERAASACGSQSALAKIINVTPQAVQSWVACGRVPATRAIQIEKATGGKVSRHELRPDLYPEPSADSRSLAS